MNVIGRFCYRLGYVAAFIVDNLWRGYNQRYRSDYLSAREWKP
jgi:hypothetical protein